MKNRNKIKRISILKLLVLVMLVMPFCALAQNFQVSGTKILDPEGNEFIAKGVNVGGYNYNKSAGNTINDVDLIVDTWKFNLVRVNCKIFENQYSYGYTDNNNMKAIIDTFTSRKCVVLIDGGHDRIGSFYEGMELDSLKSFYRELAVYTKDNPYVWFDLVNEPDNNFAKSGNKQKWTFMMQELIKTIRDAGNDNVLLVCGGSWGQDAGGGGCDNVPESWSHILSWHNDVMNFGGKSYQNIAFTLHIYNSWNCSKARLADYFDRIKAKNLAVVVGEYGSENEDKSTIQATKYMFDVCRQRNIGRVVWHWSNGDDNDLVIKVNGTTKGTNNNGGGREINDLQNPTNLTELGRLVWTDNHSIVTGTENPVSEEKFGVNIYFSRPNYLNIDLSLENGRSSLMNIAFYDLKGRELINNSLYGNQNNRISLDFINSPGIYITKIFTKDYCYSKKLYIDLY